MRYIDDNDVKLIVDIRTLGILSDISLKTKRLLTERDEEKKNKENSSLPLLSVLISKQYIYRKLDREKILRKICVLSTEAKQINAAASL